MDQEKETALLQFLSKLGFEGDELKHSLRYRVRLQLPSFQLLHHMDYGAERMSFLLYFRKDVQFEGYRLEKYKATHRGEVEIIHDNIRGIDTRELEQRMANVDWRTFFKSPHRVTDDAKQSIDETIRMLNAIADGYNFDGLKIQESLMYKYWPADCYEDPSKDELQSYFENTREFITTDAGMCNAHLAYHIVSGRLDDLHEKVNASQADRLFQTDVYDLLSQHLTTNPREFLLQLEHYSPSAYWYFSMPVTTVHDWYTADTYTLTYKPYPSFEDIVYNGVNAQKLDSAMAHIDWHDESALFIVTANEEPRLRDGVLEVQKQLTALDRCEKGANIGAALQLKYWALSPYFDAEITPTAWDSFKRMPAQVWTFGAETPAQAALNLLQGRAVAESILYPDRKHSMQWLLLRDDFQHTDAVQRLQAVSGFSTPALQKQVSMLPLSGMTVDGIVRNLLHGNVTPVSLNGGIDIFLEVDPPRQTLLVYDNQHRVIPTNLLFDVAWTPDSLSAKLQLFQRKRAESNKGKKRPAQKKKRPGK